MGREEYRITLKNVNDDGLVTPTAETNGELRLIAETNGELRLIDIENSRYIANFREYCSRTTHQLEELATAKDDESRKKIIEKGLKGLLEALSGAFPGETKLSIVAEYPEKK
ncbi:MAG: hypothetical protein WC533_01155 [Candidatus Pacearchaeota archaeon]